MSRSAVYFVFAFLAIFAGCFSVAAQGAEDRIPRPLGERRDGDTPATFKEMLSKQRILRNRKDFEEMQRRGDEALKLSTSLEQSFEQTQSVSGYDRDKLVELERIVKKIREELGGDDDDSSDEREPQKDANSVQQAFKSLKETTVSLVDELKKTTRFTISASAIQTSNTALKIIRFLRLKK